MPTEQYSNVQQILCKRLLLSLHPKIYLEGVCSSYFVARMSHLMCATGTGTQHRRMTRL